MLENKAKFEKRLNKSNQYKKDSDNDNLGGIKVSDKDLKDEISRLNLVSFSTSQQARY